VLARETDRGVHGFVVSVRRSGEIDAAMRLAPAGVEIRWVPTAGTTIDAFDGLWALPALRTVRPFMTIPCL